jgi:ribonuclease Z
MKPLFHPQLVNDPFGDPALYVDCLFQRRALMFDLGEIAPLAPRKVLRLSHVLVSHTHMDHFMGFDRVLRISLGRDKALHVLGPPGIVAQIEHKLAAYTWNLVQSYETDFTVVAGELSAHGALTRARFRCRNAFAREPMEPRAASDGVVLDEEAFRIRAGTLDHKIPCLAYALEEKLHVNVWKNRLDEQGLPTGPWLQELKRAALAGAPDDLRFHVRWRERGSMKERDLTLGSLRQDVLQVVPGQKLCYVVDAVFHQENARKIVELARGSDILYIEAAFLERDAAHAAQKYHLTAHQAGTLARMAGVKRMVPFHFSARYAHAEEHLRQEALRAFCGPAADAAFPPA